MSLPDDEPNLNPTGFDPDVAGPREWAEMYRAAGFQVVPCKDKRPDLARWADLQENLVSEATFDRWYRTGSEHGNMGMITGPCSGNVFVVDLDIQDHVTAAVWWESLIEGEANGIEPETVEQITGGGGEQKLFRAPAGYRVPTNRTSIGVDIRGQAGFAVLPPTLHASKNEYAWKPLRGPWQCRPAMAPQWLLDAIEALVGEHGGHQSNGAHTASPDADYDAWGNMVDGREHKMARTVWRHSLEAYRADLAPPSVDKQEPLILACYEDYERSVTSRIPGVDRRTGLEQEGRGITALRGKWRATMRHWGSPKMQREAAKPPPKEPEPDPSAVFEKAAEKAKAGGEIFEYLNIEQIMAMADPKWLIDKLMIEHSLGIIYGPPGSLKTFICLDVALSLATKQASWWGYGIGHTGTVIYISSEGIANLKFRIKAWAQHRGVDVTGAPFRLVRQSINFMRQEDVGKLLNTMQAIVDETGPVAAVFVDTLSRVLPGAEENLQKDMSIFVAACDAVRNRFSTTVVGVHHTNYAGGIRGSTVIPGAGDFLIETRREEGALTGSIYTKKIKDGEDGWERFFEVKKVTLGDIKASTSLVVDGIDSEAPKATADDWPDKDTLRKILAAIAEQWFRKQPWCFAKNSPRSAVVNIMRRWRISRKVVEDILAEWTANEVIIHDVCDAKGHLTGYRKMTDI